MLSDGVDWTVKSEKIDADGVIYGIIPKKGSSIEQLKKTVLNASQGFNRHIFIVPKKYTEIDSIVREFNAVKVLRDRAADDKLLFEEKALTGELESGDTQKVQSYLDYREGRITKEDFIALRSEREKRMEELKVQIAEAEAAYEDFLEKENQTKQEQAIIERTNSMNDEALKELMYDAVERINVTDNQNIEIVWKFDDLFATA